jgi:hypothetical protein
MTHLSKLSVPNKSAKLLAKSQQSTAAAPKSSQGRLKRKIPEVQNGKHQWEVDWDEGLREEQEEHEEHASANASKRRLRNKQGEQLSAVGDGKMQKKAVPATTTANAKAKKSQIKAFSADTNTLTTSRGRRSRPMNKRMYVEDPDSVSFEEHEESDDETNFTSIPSTADKLGAPKITPPTCSSFKIVVNDSQQKESEASTEHEQAVDGDFQMLSDYRCPAEHVQLKNNVKSQVKESLQTNAICENAVNLPSDPADTSERDSHQVAGNRNSGERPSLAFAADADGLYPDDGIGDSVQYSYPKKSGHNGDGVDKPVNDRSIMSQHLKNEVPRKDGRAVTPRRPFGDPDLFVNTVNSTRGSSVRGRASRSNKGGKHL